MNGEAYTISLIELNALAARYKRKVTRHWITKYERLGLLPPQNKPGLGTGKGKPSHYTPALARQLVPLIQALKLRGKNLGAAGWDLWWFGWYAAPHYWRERLLETARRWDEVRLKLTPTTDDDDRPAQLIRDVADYLENNRSPSRLIGEVKRHNKGEIIDFISPLLSVFLGTYLPLDEYSHSTDNFEREKTEKLLGTSLGVPIKEAEIPTDGKHFPISVEGLDQKLREMSGIGKINLQEFIHSLPNEEINSAKQQIAYIMNAVSMMEAYSQQQYKESAGAKALLWANRDQKLQCAHLIGWLLLQRDPAFREQCANYCETLKKIVAAHQPVTSSAASRA